MSFIVQWLATALAGALFGAGLLLSGMANPGKVLAFFDVTGQWDPSLALVMAGAIAVGMPLFAIAKKRGSTVLGTPLQLPATRTIDARLIVGSLLFGIGWGMAGICPGPALVLLGAGFHQAIAFVLAMLCGMAVFEMLERLRDRRRSA